GGPLRCADAHPVDGSGTHGARENTKRGGVTDDGGSTARRPVIAEHPRGSETAPCPARTPPPNPAAAGPGDGRVRSSLSSRVHEPCSFYRSGCPAVTDGLDGFRESRTFLRRVRGRTLAFPRLSGMLRLGWTCPAHGLSATVSDRRRRCSSPPVAARY